MGSVVLLPSQAVEAVAHEDQLNVWAHEVHVSLGMAQLLKDPDCYEDGLEVERILREEIKNILTRAFSHPEAVTIKKGASSDG